MGSPETPREVIALLEAQTTMIDNLARNVQERRRARRALVLEGHRMGISKAKLAEVLECPEGAIVTMLKSAASERS